MNLVSQVIFTYHINDPHTGIGETSTFNTIDELKNVIKAGKDYFKTPYNLTVERSVQIMDQEAPKDKFGDVLHFSISKIHPVTLGGEKINLIVADTLMYPKDVREILTKQYGTILDFDKIQKWDEIQPVYFGTVNKETKLGLRKNTRLGMNSIDLSDSAVGNPTRYNLYRVNCRYLNNKDIVVDEHLNQIWPEKTDKMLVSLVELLSKTKEIIH